MQSCRSYIREVKSESVVIIVTVLEHIVQLYPSHVPSLISPILPNLFTDTLDEVVRISAVDTVGVYMYSVYHQMFVGNL